MSELLNINSHLSLTVNHPAANDALMLKKGSPLVNFQPIPLRQGEPIPPGTSFVCERGGKNVKLVYWHQANSRYERVRIPRDQCATYFKSSSPGAMPLTLALHFNLPVSEHIAPPLQVGGYYFVMADMRLSDHRILLAGEVIVCDSVTDGLTLFSLHGGPHSDTFLLPPPDLVLLRFIAPKGHYLHSMEQGGQSTWVH